MKQINCAEHTFTPSKVVCIGRNYAEHISELGNEVPDEMVVFVKPNSAISHELRAFHQEPLHYETELCFMVENGQFKAVGLGLDLTKRDLQSKLKAKGLPWERAKSFDGAVVLSEFVRLDKIDSSLRLELRINGELIQAGGIDLMMYKPQDILNELATFMRLENADLVMTGTPKGVGVVNAGAVFQGRVLTDSQVLLEVEWLAQ